MAVFFICYYLHQVSQFTDFIELQLLLLRLGSKLANQLGQLRLHLREYFAAVA
ncbi:hypothetical protein D3C73_1470690 [compost metagenome]